MNLSTRAVLLFASLLPVFGQGPANRYALMLGEVPAAGAEGGTARAAVVARQRTLRTELKKRGVEVTGAADTVLNAVFVAAGPERVEELKALPGVVGVVRLRRYTRSLNRATQLLNAPAAWNQVGGPQNGGAGIKIAILDSGIDQSSAAFQDSSLRPPAGYPLCTPGDCAYTNNKVIVARSYVRQIAAGTGTNPALDSRPDDYSARDRDGHGTAVASCAAGVAVTGDVPISGMAPKAFLGNYKIYGSPQVNDSTSDDVIIQALEDAVKDGMDIVSFSSGGPAFTGPLDTGTACGNPAGVACDPSAMAFENAAKLGLIIVAAAGNDGETGVAYPTYATAASPGNAPSVIAAGATTNSHTFAESFSVVGTDVPSSLQKININTGDSYVPPGRWAFPLVDITVLGNDGFACAELPAGSLAGTMALVQRGPATNGCTFATKMNNVVNAGAVGMVLFMLDASSPIGPSGTGGFGLPAGMISLADGQAVKAFLAAHPGRTAAFVPGAVEQNSTGNLLAGFSSNGPTIGDAAIKPDLLAVGTSVYMAGQSYDPLGAIYSADGFAVADGTSFATPLTSGAAALVKQKHPEFTAAQVKSALVHSATQEVTADDGGYAVNMRQTGAGKLDASAAMSATVTVSPATLSFGAIKSGVLPKTISLQVVNGGTAAVSLTAAVSGSTGVSLSKTALSLGAKESDTIVVTLSGTVPAAGAYSGFVTIQGNGVLLRVPFMYIVGSGTPANLIPLNGDGFSGTVGQGISAGYIAFRLVDAQGLPVPNVAVTFSQRGGGSLQNPDRVTDAYGIAAAEAILGPTAGSYSFTAVAGGQRYTFSGFARLAPTIKDGAMVNGASFEAGAPVAPGSYVTLFGANLSDFTDYPIPGAELPMAVDYVNVSFDAPGISVPGRLTFVSPGQVNLQVPWELQGVPSAQVKVTIDYSNGNVITVPLADAAPAFFETAPGTVAALDTGYQVINAANPAVRGSTVQFFANGLGPVTNQPATGQPALASPLSLTRTQPVVTIGNVVASVSFSGLAPGFPGLYQVNAVVPEGIAPGLQPVAITIGGRSSKGTGMVVR